MRVLGLVSGGKDSCYNLVQCVKNGHEVVALLNLHPNTDRTEGDEMDSFMYQTVGHQALEHYSAAMGVPLFRHEIKGKPLQKDADYEATAGDEVEDLYEAVEKIRSKVDFDAVSAGAIASNYQKVRVENVCQRLNLRVLCYLWAREQDQLLQEMINDGMNAIIIKVAAIGLIPEQHLGKNLAEMYPILKELNVKYGINFCGEGGEYETLTLDCPLFKKKLEIIDKKIIIHSDDAFAKVGYLQPLRIELIDKS